jgi:molybdenum cofactor cytidylyltransferase
MKYSAVIAAAGLSSRMHEFKPMLCLGNYTMIANVILNLREAGIDEIVVVTGYKSELLRCHLESFNVETCNNPDFAVTTMFDSIRMGLRALSEPYDYVFLTPGDVPLVGPETLKLMLTCKGSVICPVCCGSPGHPILLSADTVPELLRYGGENGLSGFLNSHEEIVEKIDVADIGITIDANTPLDFKQLRRRQMETQSGGRLWPDIRVNISKAGDILTPETAQYLEMIDHTGSIQNASSCMHMSYTKGWNLLNTMEKELGYHLVDRFTGGTTGGGSSLTPKGRRLLTAYQTYREEVGNFAREIFDRIFTEDLRE